jgi:hypothetical protein
MLTTRAGWRLLNRRRGFRRSLAALALTGLAVLAAGCADADPSATYFPKSRPATSNPVAIGLPVTVVSQGSPSLGGGKVSRPNPDLTPGVIAVTDTDVVCSGPKRSTVVVSPADQAAVFAGYGIPITQLNKRYQIDFLVPLQLGGAATIANMWPASVRGIGYHEKQQTNFRLRSKVCRGQMPLDQAQHLMIQDWYALWVQSGTPASGS